MNFLHMDIQKRMSNNNTETTEMSTLTSLGPLELFSSHNMMFADNDRMDDTDTSIDECEQQFNLHNQDEVNHVVIPYNETIGHQDHDHPHQHSYGSALLFSPIREDMSIDHSDNIFDQVLYACSPQSTNNQHDDQTNINSTSPINLIRQRTTNTLVYAETSLACTSSSQQQQQTNVVKSSACIINTTTTTKNASSSALRNRNVKCRKNISTVCRITKERKPMNKRQQEDTICISSSAVKGGSRRTKLNNSVVLVDSGKNNVDDSLTNLSWLRDFSFSSHRNPIYNHYNDTNEREKCRKKKVSYSTSTSTSGYTKFFGPKQLSNNKNNQPSTTMSMSKTSSIPGTPVEPLTPPHSPSIAIKIARQIFEIKGGTLKEWQQFKNSPKKQSYNEEMCSSRSTQLSRNNVGLSSKQAENCSANIESNDHDVTNIKIEAAESRCDKGSSHENAQLAHQDSHLMQNCLDDRRDEVMTEVNASSNLVSPDGWPMDGTIRHNQQQSSIHQQYIAINENLSRSELPNRDHHSSSNESKHPSSSGVGSSQNEAQTFFEHLPNSSNANSNSNTNQRNNNLFNNQESIDDSKEHHLLIYHYNGNHDEHTAETGRNCGGYSATQIIYDCTNQPAILNQNQSFNSMDNSSNLRTTVNKDCQQQQHPTNSMPVVAAAVYVADHNEPVLIRDINLAAATSWASPFDDVSRVETNTSEHNQHYRHGSHIQQHPVYSGFVMGMDSCVGGHQHHDHQSLQQHTNNISHNAANHEGNHQYNHQLQQLAINNTESRFIHDHHHHQNFICNNSVSNNTDTTSFENREVHDLSITNDADQATTITDNNNNNNDDNDESINTTNQINTSHSHLHEHRIISKTNNAITLANDYISHNNQSEHIMNLHPYNQSIRTSHLAADNMSEWMSCSTDYDVASFNLASSVNNNQEVSIHLGFSFYS